MFRTGCGGKIVKRMNRRTVFGMAAVLMAALATAAVIAGGKSGQCGSGGVRRRCGQSVYGEFMIRQACKSDLL